jgi:CRP-like cAMP-binding protein
MTLVDQSTCRNLIFRSMAKEDFALLAPGLRQAKLKLDELLAVAGRPVLTVCFPEAGIVTVSDVMKDGGRVGIGHFGYDGFSGWPVLLGCDRSPHEARVTADGGNGFHIAPSELLSACRASETLRDLLLRFVQAFQVQLGRTVVSNLTQSVESRLCRWTLMAHDRIEADEIKVTHAEIGVMLGVRRASVTDALHILEGEGLISARRGTVTILDRDGLRRLAGETYGYYEAEYSRLIAPFPRDGLR